MTKYFLAREGTIATTAVKTALQKFGSTTTASDILVPGNAQSLNHLIGWVSSAMSSTSGTADYFLRTEGNGLPNGPEAWAIGACGEVVAAVQGITSFPMYYNSVGLPTKAGGNTVQLFADSTAGTTLGASTMGAVAVFDTGKAPTTNTRTYDVATSTTQTDVTMTAQGSNANPPLTSPGQISQLSRITAAVASSAGTVGRQVHLLRVGGQSIGTELDLVIGAIGGQQATATVGIWSAPFQVGHDGMSADYTLDVPANPTQSLTVQMSNAETNTGATQGVVTLEFV
ncbi:MAG TPA: hypothetical protein VNW25_00030 [Candidatus Sulfotelmatobacter sp.]|nr:hypothetical protein [Candidatus Sulfotelmatobacter sp.]